MKMSLTVARKKKLEEFEEALVHLRKAAKHIEIVQTIMINYGETIIADRLSEGWAEVHRAEEKYVPPLIKELQEVLANG